MAAARENCVLPLDASLLSGTRTLQSEVCFVNEKLFGEKMVRTHGHLAAIGGSRFALPLFLREVAIPSRLDGLENRIFGEKWKPKPARSRHVSLDAYRTAGLTSDQGVSRQQRAKRRNNSDGTAAGKQPDKQRPVNNDRVILVDETANYRRCSQPAVATPRASVNETTTVGDWRSALKDGRIHDGRRSTSNARYESRGGWSVSTVGLEQDACRICYDGDTTGECTLVVCSCTTSVHPSCLVKWLRIAELDRCEVCRDKFTLVNKLNPVCEWKIPPGYRCRCSLVSFVFFCILYPAFCIWIVISTDNNFQTKISLNRGVELGGLLILMVVGSLVFIVSLVKVVRELRFACQRWREANKTIYLVNKGVYWKYEPCFNLT